MRIETGQTNPFAVGNQINRNNQRTTVGANTHQTTNAAQGTSMRKLLYEQRQKEQAQQDIVKQSLGYTDSLKANRSKAKDTSLALKKLHYNFKGISSQIMRSKTSAGARQVVGKARREVIRLKRQKADSSYDSEEVQAAIVHAQALERVAKKKLRHLQEEEMLRVNDGTGVEMEEETKETQDPSMEESEQLQENTEESMQDQMEAVQDQMADMQEQMEREVQEAMDDLMTMMQQKLWDAMEEMMEELDLMEEMSGGQTAPGEEIDPNDFRLMKLKHRSEEMKDIAKADSAYLKAMFDRYDKLKNGGAVPSGSAGQGAIAPVAASPVAAVAMPAAAAPSFTPSVGIDVSI